MIHITSCQTDLFSVHAGWICKKMLHLVELTPVIVNQLKPGGIYITSGIIDDKEEMVKEAVAKAGLELLEVTYQGEWVCVTARKNA